MSEQSKDARTADDRVFPEVVEFCGIRYVREDLYHELAAKLQKAQQLCVRQANELRRLAGSKSQQKRYEEMQRSEGP